MCSFYNISLVSWGGLHIFIFSQLSFDFEYTLIRWKVCGNGVCMCVCFVLWHSNQKRMWCFNFWISSSICVFFFNFKFRWFQVQVMRLLLVMNLFQRTKIVNEHQNNIHHLKWYVYVVCVYVCVERGKGVWYRWIYYLFVKKKMIFNWIFGFHLKNVRRYNWLLQTYAKFLLTLTMEIMMMMIALSALSALFYHRSGLFFNFFLKISCKPQV